MGKKEVSRTGGIVVIIKRLRETITHIHFTVLLLLLFTRDAGVLPLSTELKGLLNLCFACTTLLDEGHGDSIELHDWFGNCIGAN